ncbi:MAG TPA: hypothetical protein VFZ70_06550 [Euzebyales bacterium]
MSVVIENQARTANERRGRAPGGILPAVVIIATGLLAATALLGAVAGENGTLGIVAVILLAGAAFGAIGLYLVQPNMAAVLTFFGDYGGTDRAPGLRWTPTAARPAGRLRPRRSRPAGDADDATGGGGA